MEEALYQLLLANERKGMNAVFDQYYPYLFNTAHRMVGQHEAAEHVVQEVLIDFWNNRRWQKLDRSIKAYLRQAVTFKAIDAVRQQARQAEVPLDVEQANHMEAQPHDQLEYQELQQRIGTAIDSLPPKCRAIFMLSRFEAMTNKEIARQLQLSIKTVEQQMTIALRKMHQALAL